MKINLQPHQKAPILFRYQTFRQPVQDKSDSEPDFQSELHERVIKVDFMADTGYSIQTFQVIVKPLEMHCDQVFRYYEPEMAVTQVMVPNFLRFDGVGDLQLLS